MANVRSSAGCEDQEENGGIESFFVLGHIPREWFRHQTRGLKRQAGQSADGRAGAETERGPQRALGCANWFCQLDTN